MGTALLDGTTELEVALLETCELLVGVTELEIVLLDKRELLVGGTLLVGIPVLELLLDNRELLVILEEVILLEAR